MLIAKITQAPAVSRNIPTTKARPRALSHHSTPGSTDLTLFITERLQETLKPDTKENDLGNPKGILPRRPYCLQNNTAHSRQIKKNQAWFYAGN